MWYIVYNLNASNTITYIYISVTISQTISNISNQFNWWAIEKSGTPIVEKWKRMLYNNFWALCHIHIDTYIILLWHTIIKLNIIIIVCAIIEYILIIRNHFLAFTLIELKNNPIYFSLRTIKGNVVYIYGNIRSCLNYKI